MSITLRRPSDPPAETPPPGGAEAPPRRSGKRAGDSRPTKAPRAGGAARGEELQVGGEPRVDLLPPEVRTARRDRRMRRGFGWGVLAVAVVVVLATGAAFAFTIAAQARLASARIETASLLAQQQQYAEVREVQRQVALAKAAQQVGASTEIAWKPFLEQVAAVQPAGVALTSVTVDSASPIAVYQQSPDPLQGPRIGTVTLEAMSPTLPDVVTWVAALEKVPGVVDAIPGATNFDATSGQYVVTVTMHLDDTLYTKRFAPEEQ